MFDFVISTYFLTVISTLRDFTDKMINVGYLFMFLGAIIITVCTVIDTYLEHFKRR